MKRYTKDYKAQIVNMYFNDKLSCIEIGKRLNFNQSTINCDLKKWGYTTRSLKDNNHIYSVDDNYFDNINTEEKAYWLGFLYADGYLTSRNFVGLAIKNTDKGHLEKFQNSIKATFPIKEYTSKSHFGTSCYVRLTFKSNNMFRNLVEKGMVERKSLILTFPSLASVEEKYQRHFIRGYFDGDGSIAISRKKDRNYKESFSFKLCGTKEFLNSVIDILNQNIENKLNYKFYKRRQDDKNNYYIDTSGQYKTYEILKYLYEDSNIYLDRKYERYLLLKQVINSRL